MSQLEDLLGGLLAGGGLNKFLSGFQENGMASQADSWVGTGPNVGKWRTFVVRRSASKNSAVAAMR